MTEQPYVDPGHRVPDDEWAKVVARAKEIREQTQAEAQGGASSGIAPVLDLTAKGRASGKYFPVSGVPTQLLVLHSAECPLAGGYAQSLTEWASSVYPSDPIASWQRFVDPLVRLRFIPDELGAWHASEANPLSIGWEQAGYARYTRDQWLTPDGRTQMESLAFDMAEVAAREGIPARWLSDQEVRAVLDGGNRSIKGFCFHRQIDPETRTDPGGGYPAELLMQRIQFYMTGGTIQTQSTTTITPAEEEGFLMALSDKQQEDIYWMLCSPDGRQYMADLIGGRAADRTLNTEIPRGGEGASIGDGKTTLAGMVAWNDSHVIGTISAIAASEAKSGASAEEIEAAVRKAMEEGVVRVDVSVGTSPKEGA